VQHSGANAEQVMAQTGVDVGHTGQNALTIQTRGWRSVGGVETGNPHSSEHRVPNAHQLVSEI